MALTLKTCLRCDWEGETTDPQCPNCGIQPLYVVPASPPEGAGSPIGGGREERSRATSTARSAPLDTPSPPSEPPPSSAHQVEPTGRSDRSLRAFVLAALVLSIAVGTWMTAQTNRSAPAASADVRDSPAGSPTPASPSRTPARVFPLERPDPLVGRTVVIVDRVRFSFNVPQFGWERFGTISINKSIIGPQGAEAIIFWTTFPGGEEADPCPQLIGPPVGASAFGLEQANLAAAVATAPGTELVSGPSDVTVGGRPAQHVVLTVRKEVGCDPGFFYAWEDVEAGPLWTTTGVGDTIKVWIVDVDGKRLFIEAATTEEADSLLKLEIQQIVESIRFD